jgi:hypothetical protein
MTLIRVTNHNVAALPYLFRLVLRYIYEKDKMSLNDIHLMQDSIVWWSKKADLSADEQFHVEKLGYLLQQAEEGKFEDRRKSFIQHGISWRRFHRLNEFMIIKP